MPSQFITLDEILKLFKKKLGVTIPRSSVYYYIHHKKFPTSNGFGRPRLWKKSKVLKWFKQHTD